VPVARSTGCGADALNPPRQGKSCALTTRHLDSAPSAGRQHWLCTSSSPARAHPGVRVRHARLLAAQFDPGVGGSAASWSKCPAAAAVSSMARWSCCAGVWPWSGAPPAAWPRGLPSWPALTATVRTRKRAAPWRAVGSTARLRSCGQSTGSGCSAARCWPGSSGARRSGARRRRPNPRRRRGHRGRRRRSRGHRDRRPRTRAGSLPSSPIARASTRST
jgi:hypothetical protein